MVECSTIDDPRFKEGGMFKAYIGSAGYEEFAYLCPENGNINVGGLLGTSLWILPVQNSDNYDFKVDPTPYYDNVANILFVTSSFQIDQYAKMKSSDFFYAVENKGTYVICQPQPGVPSYCS
jgi:hypothetical protein